MQIFKTPHFDFLRWRWFAIGLSWLIIIAGLVEIKTHGLPLGVEFSGGTIVIVQFDQQPPDSSVIRNALERAIRVKDRTPSFSGTATSRPAST